MPLVDDDERMKDLATRPLVLACAVTAASVLAIPRLALTGVGLLECLGWKALRISPLAGLPGVLGGAALTGVVRGTCWVSDHWLLSARSPLTSLTSLTAVGGGPRPAAPTPASGCKPPRRLPRCGSPAGLLGAVEPLLAARSPHPLNAVFSRGPRRTIHSVRGSW